jgi:phosphomannomutase
MNLRAGGTDTGTRFYTPRAMSATAATTAEPLIVSVSGLRGVVDEALTAEVAARYAAAFSAGLPPGPIVLGRDGRANGPPLAAALAAFLVGSGRDVIECGVAATPTIGIAVRERRAAGGIQVSASHNPARYNGIKLFSADGRVLPAAEGAVVRARFETLPRGPAAAAAPGRQPGRVLPYDPTADHVARVAAIVDVAAIRRRRPRVWLDAGHGAGSVVARRLFEELGCEQVIVGGEPDGLFEHEPEPTAENLAGLLPRIAAARADVGFFQDPDADRLAIATAAGEYIGEEATLALAAEGVLMRIAEGRDARFSGGDRGVTGPLVVNCSTSGMTAAVAARHGVACQVAAVGEANVVDRMLACDAVLGGEGNGGVIDPRVGLVRDSFVAMALLLERLALETLPGGDPTTVAALAAALPRLVMRKTKQPLSAALQGPGLAAGLARIEQAFPEARADRLDGLRLDWDGGWLLVRGSNTEPIVRLVAEAATDDDVAAALDRAARALAEAAR